MVGRVTRTREGAQRRLSSAEIEAATGGCDAALPVGEARRNDMRVTADEAAHLLLCAYADGGGQAADADAAGGGRRQRYPDGAMRIQKALIEDTISMKKAGLLLYSMQLAMTNVGQTTFGQAKDEEMVRETVDEDEALSDQPAISNQRR